MFRHYFDGERRKELRLLVSQNDRHVRMLEGASVIRHVFFKKNCLPNVDGDYLGVFVSRLDPEGLGIARKKSGFPCDGCLDIWGQDCED